jgi:hypothetical protein
MKSLVVLFVALSSSAAVHAADAPASADPNVELVRAMRSDEIALSGAKRAFLTGAVAEKYPVTDKKCVKRFEYAEFTEGFAGVVRQVLNPAEIAEALKFYQSPAGVKYVEGTLRRLRTRFGDDSGVPEIKGKEEISPQQLAEISDFTRSDLGHKIMGKDMTESPAALKMGREMLERIAAKCARK